MHIGKKRNSKRKGRKDEKCKYETENPWNVNFTLVPHKVCNRFDKFCAHGCVAREKNRSSLSSQFEWFEQPDTVARPWQPIMYGV